MADEKSEIAILREAVHSIGEAMQLLDKIFQGQGAAFNSEPYQKLKSLIQDVLNKTSPYH